MNAIGIDVSKGKSIVAIVQPLGIIVRNESCYGGTLAHIMIQSPTPPTTRKYLFP